MTGYCQHRNDEGSGDAYDPFGECIYFQRARAESLEVVCRKQHEALLADFHYHRTTKGAARSGQLDLEADRAYLELGLKEEK